MLQPGDEILELESSIPSGPFARAFSRAFEGVSDHYTMSLQGSLIGWRTGQAIRLLLMPRDAQRYGFRLWLDEETGLLLRSESIDTNGTKLEIFQFATLKVGGPITEKDLAPETGAGSHTSHLSLESQAPPKRAASVQWRADWVPDGFTMASWDIRRTPSSPRSVDTLMYSDGLAAFSVFIEACRNPARGELVSRSGGTVAVSEVVAGGPQQSHHLVTVVGEIPTATAHRIAQSIRYVPNDSRRYRSRGPTGQHAGAARPRQYVGQLNNEKRMKTVPSFPRENEHHMNLFGSSALWPGAAALTTVLAQLRHAARELPDFTGLVEKYSPAVVNVSTTQKADHRSADNGGNPDMDEFFRRFFGPEGRRSAGSRRRWWRLAVRSAPFARVGLHHLG